MDFEGININFLGHSGFLIENGKRIIIDPYNVSDKVEKADIILITHSHFDHCSIKDIQNLSKEGTIIVIPPDAQSKITKIDKIEMQLIEPGDEIDIRGIKIQAILAYNKDKDFHPRSENWIGYLIKINNAIIYHAGDTDLIPEMQKLTGYGKKGNNFIALLPVSGGTVMNYEEAANAASLIKPDLAIPMHYGSGVLGTIDDANNFVELCLEKDINSKVLEKL